jgi:transformation/transcription domain-associated protein
MLGQSDDNASRVILRLFKVVFGAVTLFPDNEHVLRPHLNSIVSACMKSATEERVTPPPHRSNSSQKPGNYYQLLKALFRSINGGKFDLLHKELIPSLKSTPPPVPP